MTNADGYVFKYCPKHPRANNGYVPLHQLVMETKIGRFLDTRSEHVHHIDENPSNNDHENLQLVSPMEHRRIHAGWRLVEGEWLKPCAGCDQLLLVEANFHRRGKTSYQNLCRSCDRVRLAPIRQSETYKAKMRAYAARRRISERRQLKEAA